MRQKISGRERVKGYLLPGKDMSSLCHRGPARGEWAAVGLGAGPEAEQL